MSKEIKIVKCRHKIGGTVDEEDFSIPNLIKALKELNVKFKEIKLEIISGVEDSSPIIISTITFSSEKGKDDVGMSTTTPSISI